MRVRSLQPSDSTRRHSEISVIDQSELVKSNKDYFLVKEIVDHLNTADTTNKSRRGLQ